jgi:small conductance mechanosensitive channel
MTQSINNHWEQIIFALVILAVAFIVGRIVRFVLGRFLRASAKKLKVDPTRYNFFKNAVDLIIFLGAIIIIFRSIPALQVFSTTLLTGAGVLAAIVGFASQSAFSNIISGIFLVIFRPFSVGDRVKIGQLYNGDVEDITLRHTVIKDFENRRIIIPNNVISNETIINSTIVDEKVIMFVEFTISLSSPIDKACAVIQEETKRHPYCIDNRTPDELAKGEPQVMVRVISFVDSGLLLRAYAWARNPTEGFELKCDLHKTIKERFDAEGIEIPYPYRTFIYKDHPSNLPRL